MQQAAEEMEFEKAGEYRELLGSVKKIAQKQKITNSDMEDKDVNSYYCFSGKIWRDQLLDIYNNMNVIQYESDSEPFKFVEDVNYDSEILGEVKQIFKLNINYNQEILGMV